MTDALTVLLSTGAGAVAAWISKNMFLERLKNAIRHEYEQKLETLKAQLRCESEKEIETTKARLKSDTDKEVARLNSQLQIAASERNTRYSNVFEKRVQGISDVHKKLLDFKNAVSIYATSGNSSRPEKFKMLQDAGGAFKEAFDSNLLFIPETTASQFSPLYNLLFEKALKFSSGEYDADLKDALSDSEQFVKLLKLLERDCRTLFGDYDKISSGKTGSTKD